MFWQFATLLSMRSVSPMSSRRARVLRRVWSRIPLRIVGQSRRTTREGFAPSVGSAWMKHLRFIAWVSSRKLQSLIWFWQVSIVLVCEYYAHIECQDFAIADCKENATYVPGKELLSVKHVHHWREGNLPQSSKCAYCKKTCWSSECLTGKLPKRFKIGQTFEIFQKI